nr:UDP-glycosyltransferase UGT73CB3 [Aralia elata]
MATEDPKLHVLILPHFTPSHIMPLVEIGRLIAARGVNITIITTPHNANLFRSSVNQDINSGHQISVHELKFPSAEVGLPEGIENFSAITSTDMSAKVFYGIMLLQKPMEDLIRNLSPDCIFSDMFYPWTVELAEELKIPRLLFYPTSFLCYCVTHSLKLYAPYDMVQSDTESFLVPDLPDNIEMKRCQLQEHVTNKTRFGELMNAIEESELKSYGLVHQTFYELEPAYADHYGKIKPAKFWSILPLFQFFKGEKKEQMSNDSISEQHNCLSWLDTQKPNSVVFVCFGSMVRFSDAQLTEIALALEASNHPFIWVVRKSEESREKQEESWLPAGFEERMVEGNKGMIVRGWSPQVKILAHPATAAFMTHCGWNSVLEAVAAGVPLITWPLFAEQFRNEKLIEILKIGIGVGAEVCNPTFEITCPPVGRDKIEKALSKLMGGSEESQKIRQKVKEMAALAKGAVEEDGSSYNNITALVEDLKACAFEKSKSGYFVKGVS